jgi:hypothetical protein
MGRLGRLRFPLALVALGIVGTCAGVSLASTPERTGVQASAEQIDCATAPNMSAEDLQEVKTCWTVKVDSPLPPQTTEAEIAVAKTDALCEAITAVAERPDVCAVLGGER